MYVYLLQHVHEIDEDTESTKVIGIYSTEEQAKAAVERMRIQPGFRDSPDGFCIDPYLVDKDHWTKGFVTVSRESDDD